MFISFSMSVFPCMYICGPHLYPLPIEVRRGHKSPCNQAYRLLWETMSILGFKFVPLQELQMPLIIKPSPHPQMKPSFLFGSHNQTLDLVFRQICFLLTVVKAPLSSVKEDLGFLLCALD